MNEPTLMGMVQSPRGLRDEVGRLAILERTFLANQCLKIGSLDILHHQVMSIAFVIDIVSPNDIRMIQRSDRFGLLLERCR